MITFDRLKLVAPLDSVRVHNFSAFERIEKDGKICAYRYHQDFPYLLIIKVDYDEGEVVIEFTGKVLQRRYPELISIRTIEQCFNNINDMGFISLNLEAMMNADVVSCDVTKDVACDDIPKQNTYLKGHIRSYSLYNCKLNKMKNLTIEKNVVTRKCKKRMIIYDKGKEMSSAENKRFTEENGLSGIFDGVARFEMNLNSKQQIREALNIKQTRLKDVLNSDSSPIASFIESCIEPSSEIIEVNDRKSYFTMLVLQDCGFDLERVEARMRMLYKRGTKFSEVMQPYKDMLSSLSSQKDRGILPELLGKLRSES